MTSRSEGSRGRLWAKEATSCGGQVDYMSCVPVLSLYSDMMAEMSISSTCVRPCDKQYLVIVFFFAIGVTIITICVAIITLFPYR